MRKILLFLSAAMCFLLLGNNAFAANGIVYSTPNVYNQGATVDLIPTVTGGAATLISHTGTLPAGLTLNANGTITGNPTTIAGAVTLTVTVRIGFTNYTSNSFTIQITNPLAPNLTYNTTNVFATNSNVTLTPANSGGTPTSSTPTPSGLPTGLSISSTGVISGIPTVVTATTSYTVSSTNVTGTTTSNTFTIQIADAPAFSYLTPDGPTTTVAYTLTPTITAGSPTNWTETGTMPAGLTLNASTGVISGTPTSTTSRTIIVTATNSVGLSASQTIVIRPVATALFTYTNPAAYTVGVPITSLSPTTSSGFALTLATITPNLTTNTGLAISAAGVVSGTPTTPSAATVYTVTAMASSGYYGTATVTITVNAPPPPNISYTPSSYTFTAGIAGTTSAVVNSGGAATYSVDPTTPLPSYLTFNSSTGVISCSTTAVVTSATNYIVDATNITATVTTTVSITIIAAAPPIISYTPSSYTFTAGTAGTTSAITNSGGAAVYSIDASTPLPAYLTFDASTGIFSCSTAGVATPATNYLVDATNSTGTVNTTVSITINPAAPVIYYTPATYTFYAGVAGATSSASNTGGTATFSVDASTPFPSYLSIDPVTGIITASASSVIAAAAIYTIDATNITATASTAVTITIAGPPILSYAGTPYTYVQGTVTTIPIVNSGGAPTGSPLYTLTGTPPTGITFNTGSGLFSIAATAAVGTYTFSVSASNPAGPSAPPASISITINPKAPVISYTPAAYSFYAGVGGTTSAATNTGGTATYSVDAATPFPSYLSIDPTTGIITASAGAVTTAATVYKIDAANVTATASTNVTITIVGAPVLAYTGTPYTYVQGTATTISISNTGGAPTSTYALTGTPPTGITYSTATGKFTIATNAAVGTYTFTVTASNPAGSSAPSITIIINPKAPVINYTTPNTWLVGTTYTLNPTNSGGTVSTWSYTGTLPPGISFNNTNGTISGNPTTPGSYSVTVTASNVTSPSSNKTVNFTIKYPNPVISYSPANPYLSGASISLPVTNSEAAVTTGYTYTGTLPAGVTLDGTAGTISGTLPTVTGQTTYTVTVTASTGSSTGNTTVSIIIDPLPPSISYNTPNVYPVSVAIPTLSPNTSAGGAVAAQGLGTGTNLTVTPNFNGPQGMAFDAAGNLYVVNNNGTIKVFNSAGTYTGTFGSGLTDPVGMVFDASGNAYVLDANKNKVYEFNSGGSLINTLSVTGLNAASAIAIDSSGNLYIANTGGDDVLEVNSGTGAIIKTITSNVYNPTGVAVDNSGNIYVSNSYNFATFSSTIIKYTPAGAYSSTFKTNNGAQYSTIYIDNSGNIYLGAYALGFPEPIVEYNSAGTTIMTENGFSNPQGILVDSKGDVFVSDNNNNAVTEYGPTGGFYISGPLPPGLSFSNATGQITGTPSAAFPTTSYTVTAYNVSGHGTSNTFTITCAYPPSFSYTPAAEVDTVGMASPSMSPTVTAGGPISSYTIGSLPAGLSIDPVTGVISGTPTTTSPLTAYTVTATNSSTGLTGTATDTITVVNPRAPTIAYTTPDIYITNVGIIPLAPTNTGGLVVSYSAPSLPAGLVIDPVTGIISGTPTTITPAANYAVTATNAGGSSTFNINITVNPPAPNISYVTPQVYNVGTTISPLVPTNTPGAVATWTISPALPPGLSFDTTTGIISGTPAAISANTNYTVTATNVTGSSTTTVTIEVNSSTPVISYTTPDTYTVGNVIAPLVPTNTGSAAVSWSISAALPSGLNFDTTTGIITGTPTAVSAAANYTVTATNGGGSGTFVINIACVNPGPVLSYTTPDIFPVGIAVTPLAPVNTGSAPISYAISPGLPTGLNFDTTTGIISGTPTAPSGATTYTITATDASSNTGTASVSIACTAANNWLGGTSTDWTDGTNWALGTMPSSTDVAAIGVNVPFTHFPNLLAGAGTINVGSVIIGTNGGQAGGVVANSGSTLNVSGTITYQSDSNAGLAYLATLSGAGSITASGINVTANTPLGSTYTETMASSVNSLALSGNLTLTSTDASGNDFNAAFNVTGGITSIAGAIQTNNTANGASTLSVASATLQLAGSSALSGLSGTGTNVITFNNTGATIEYSGAGQTYYTNAGINGLSSGLTYNSIKFSGSGLKSPNGTNANNLTVTGDFTNALTTCDASDYIDLSTPLVTFNGTTQNIYGGNGTGTKFYNVTFSGTGATTIQSGSVAVASIGVLTMSGSSSTLATGGLLTLNSDVNGTATVAAIPTGCGITGTVNAQRFITGGAFNYRGYRLVSSPVYGSNDGTSNIYSINYLINTVYLKGSGGTAGGWDAAGNPNVFLFRENLAGTNQTFSSGNFRSLATIGTPPNFSYMVDNDGGPYNIPVGNGFMFFFRGDRNIASLTTETNTTYIPTNATLTASGTLNQGQVTVSDWYTPASTNLGYTTISGDPRIEGFNLVGNPYASSIDWDNFDASSATAGIYGPNVNPFLYIIDPINNNYNIYQAKSGIAGTQGIPNSNVIPSGQGFLVTAANASAQLIFSESAKTNAQANAANGNLLMAGRLRSAIKASLPASMPQYLHLEMAKDSANSDGMIISFRSNASRNFNAAEDAPYRLGNGSVVISSMSADNVPLGFNTMPLPATTGQTIIPLNVWGTVDGTYTINMDKVNAIPALFTIWLKDAYKKDSLDIKDNPIYTFDVLNSDTNSYGKHRFTLVMGENPALMIHLLSFGASKIQSGDQVVWTTENEQNYTNFTVERSTDAGTTFNDLGGFLSTGQGTYSYLDKAPVNGANMYRLKIVDINGTVSYSNIVTIMYANTNGQIAINGLMVYPNPTAGTVHLSIPTNQGTTTKPNYNIEIVNNLGSVIKSSQSSSPLWQSDVSSLTPGTYFIRVIDTSNNTVIGKSAFVKL